MKSWGSTEGGNGGTTMLGSSRFITQCPRASRRASKTQAGNESSTRNTAQRKKVQLVFFLDCHVKYLHFSVIRCALIQHPWTFPLENAHCLLLVEHHTNKGFVLWIFNLLIQSLNYSFTTMEKSQEADFLWFMDIKQVSSNAFTKTRCSPEDTILISLNFPACFHTATVHAYFTHLRLVCCHVLP